MGAEAVRETKNTRTLKEEKKACLTFVGRMKNEDVAAIYSHQHIMNMDTAVSGPHYY